MSALCQKRTSVDLFDDLVGAGEQSSDQTIRPASFGNFAIFTAIRRASSLLNKLAGGHTALGGTMKHWTFGITPSP
jgi:hypothetical protein